jgi:MFS superfamily sulfate permease-like transporter
LYVLVIAFGFEVAVAFALVVAVVLIVEHAVNTEVLDRVDVISVVELEEEVALKVMLEVVEATTLDEELEEADRGPVFLYRSSLRNQN